MSKITIKSPNLPDPIGPFSQAVLVDKTLYVSGMLGVDSKNQLVSDNAVEQARKALENIGHVLNAAGCTYDNVVKTTLLLADINDFAAINEVYKEFFKLNFPARATYQVAALPRNARFEIELIAVLDSVPEGNLKSVL